MNTIEAFVLPLLGAAVSLKQADLDALCDSVGQKIAIAVKDSDTALDDFAANILAGALERVAAKVRADLATAAE